MQSADARTPRDLFGVDRSRSRWSRGCFADVNVIDFDALHIHAPQMVDDLPAQGKRLIQKIEGYRYTVKSGQVTFADSEPTGELPGKLVRGPQAAPAA